MNILERLEKIAESVIDFFSKIPNEIKGFTDEALYIVALVDEALKSGTAVVITDIIPGTWDDKFRHDAIIMVDGLLEVLKSIKQTRYIDKVEAVSQQMILQKMAATLVAIQDGSQLPQNRYDMYTQIAYSKMK